MKIKNLHHWCEKLATQQATQQDEKMKKLLEFCKTAKSRREMQEYMELTDREYFRANILKPLIESGLIQPTLPDKPNSPKQKYYYKPNY